MGNGETPLDGIVEALAGPATRNCPDEFAVLELTDNDDAIYNVQLAFKVDPLSDREAALDTRDKK